METTLTMNNFVFGAPLWRHLWMPRNNNMLVFQSSCAAAIRNIVSRSREFCNEFIDLEIEPLLNEVQLPNENRTTQNRAFHFADTFIPLWAKRVGR